MQSTPIARLMIKCANFWILYKMYYTVQGYVDDSLSQLSKTATKSKKTD